MAKFPDWNWFETLKEKLNSDEQYGRIAQKWEGDILFIIEPAGKLKEQKRFYIDLWHGKCRGVEEIAEDKKVNATFTLSAPYTHYVSLLKGELDPMQAMLTRKLHVQGNMAIMMRSVPTVLDFMRCCKEITDGFLE